MWYNCVLCASICFCFRCESNISKMPKEVSSSKGFRLFNLFIVDLFNWWKKNCWKKLLMNESRVAHISSIHIYFYSQLIVNRSLCLNYRFFEILRHESNQKAICSGPSNGNSQYTQQRWQCGFIRLNGKIWRRLITHKGDNM